MDERTNAPTDEPVDDSLHVTPADTEPIDGIDPMVDDAIPVVTDPGLDEMEESVTHTDDAPVPSSAETLDDEEDTDGEFYGMPFDIPGAPESSADGRWLAYLMPNEAGENDLWIVSTTDGETRQIDLTFEALEDRDPETGRILRGPQWSPDGTTIAVTGMHPDGDRTAVWMVPTGLEDVEQADQSVVETDDVVTEAEPAAESDASSQDVTETHIDIADEIEAAAASADHSDDEVIREPVAGEISEPRDPLDLEDGSFESPEPTQDDIDAVSESAPVDAPTRRTEPYLLVDHAAADRSPRFSPDGEIIAMTSSVDGRDVITLIPAHTTDPSEVELLTWSRANDKEPVWSRDGKFLAFLRERTDGVEHHDIMCYSLETGTLDNLTSEKETAVRHSLEWVPGRNLIAYVTLDGEWLSISVINADNKAGWTVTRETGDKTDPRFAQSEARLVYVRTEGFTTVICERSLHSSAAVALDPGEGVVRYPRWLDGKRVAYGFTGPQRPFGFFTQENTAKSDRNVVMLPGQPPIGGQSLRQPEPLEFEVGPEETFSGMLYRTRGTSGKIPGIVYLPDGPLHTRRGEFQIEEQALASTSLAVLTPVIHGATGFGSGVENDLREFSDTEIEDIDIAEAGRALGRVEGVDPDRLTLVGHGFGGTLALVAAGAQPGVYAAVVAIDPIIDWSVELMETDIEWRNWVTDRFGLPMTNANAYALRTPATYSAVVDVPMLLVRTENAPEYRKQQLDYFTEDLDGLGREYQVLDVPAEPLSMTLRRVSRELSRMFLDGKEEADIVEDLNPEDLG